MSRFVAVLVVAALGLSTASLPVADAGVGQRVAHDKKKPKPGKRKDTRTCPCCGMSLAPRETHVHVRCDRDDKPGKGPKGGKGKR